jgi:hypothetical protein
MDTERNMEIIEGSALSSMCDYSFGDHMGAASIPRPKGGFMKEANYRNGEFLGLCTKYEGRIMTLFIDNIRLYNRPIMAHPQDAEWLTYLLSNNDLLELCGRLTKNKFVIFCSHEDTPIDSHIKVPPNVLGIHAVNAEFNNEKIYPFPYGLQRELGESDGRLSIMKQRVEEDRHQEPTKLLYINCGLGSERNNLERAYLVNFEGLPWTTCRFDKDSKFFPYERYNDFLTELKSHKFMVCPQGHGLDCHRNWESLYMRRVPVMKDHPYFRKLMKGFPVLFVNDWSDITEELLITNDHLYREALVMNMQHLNLTLIFDTIIKSYGIETV